MSRTSALTGARRGVSRIHQPWAYRLRTRVQLRTRVHLWLVARGDRPRHNPHDVDCDYWTGDRSVATGDRRNIEFSGDATPVMVRRCVRCSPYPDTDAETLLSVPPLEDL